MVCEFWQQNGAIPRNAARIETAEPPSISNGAQATENERKNSFLNYQSRALPLKYRPTSL
jgi:hypothetical protein